MCFFSLSSRRAIFFCRSFVRSSVNEFVTYAHLLCATLAFEYASNQRYQFIGIKWMFYRNRLMRHKQFKSHILVDFFPRFWTDIWCVYLMIECQLRIWLLVIKCKWFGSFFGKFAIFARKFVIRFERWTPELFNICFFLMLCAISMQSLLIVSECTLRCRVIFFYWSIFTGLCAPFCLFHLFDLLFDWSTNTPIDNLKWQH